MEAMPEQSNDRTMVLSVYILYLVSVLLPITLLVGLIIAYVNYSAVPDSLRTHYQFQIRTFWMMLLYSAIAMLFIYVPFGFLLLGFTFIWFMVRCVKGLQAFNQKQAHPQPKTWWL